MQAPPLLRVCCLTRATDRTEVECVEPWGSKAVPHRSKAEDLIESQSETSHERYREVRVLIDIWEQASGGGRGPFTRNK